MVQLTLSSLHQYRKMPERAFFVALAEALNVSVKTVSHWETGYTEPSVLQRIQLANYFDITIDELVGRTI